MKIARILLIILNFIGALLIIASTGIYAKDASMRVMGHYVILNLHPNLLKLGVALIIIAFIMQLFIEIYKNVKK